MDDLRRDVNEVFDKGQAELGNLGVVRERIVRQALAARGSRSDRRMQVAGGLAAIVIATLVIATFAYVRAGHHVIQGGPRVTPTPSASPTPLSQSLNVPTDTPVIVYHDPANFGQTDGITWDGKLSGKVDWGGVVGMSNPAGNLFGTATEIRDRSGRILASGNFGAKSFQATWADDEVSFCRMIPFDFLGANGTPATLQLISLRGDARPRNVARVGKVYEQGNLRVDACSVRQDRAVVVQSGGQGVGTAQYWVVQLSTGKILWTHNFQEQTSTVTIVASPDGRFIAENKGSQVQGSATIYGSDGAALGRIAGTVAAFSWDGSLLVIDPGTGAGSALITRRQDGSVLWTGPTGQGFFLLQSVAQPDGAGIAIGVADPNFPMQSTDPTTAGFTPVDFYLIGSDGHVLVVMKGLYW
jgi:hypothetical protein